MLLVSSICPTVNNKTDQNYYLLWKLYTEIGLDGWNVMYVMFINSTSAEVKACEKKWIKKCLSLEPLSLYSAWLASVKYSFKSLSVGTRLVSLKTQFFNFYWFEFA